VTTLPPPPTAVMYRSTSPLEIAGKSFT
jgi:hypothetical protein